MAAKMVRVAASSVLLPPFFGALPLSKEDICVFPDHVLRLLLLLQWFGACPERALLWALLLSVSPAEVSAVAHELSKLRF